MTKVYRPAKLQTAASTAGFALAEVLIAMVILAVGLMALQALGVGVAKSLVFSERQDEFTVEAGAELENALREFRGGSTPASACTVLPNGDRISRSISVTNTDGTGLGEVSVTYLPSTTSTSRPPAVTVVGSAFSPTALAAPNPDATDCFSA